jgi:glutathione S-transferase
MKIYSGPVSMFGAKVQIAAAEKGIEFDLEMVPFKLWGPQRYDPVHPEVARINPKGQVPVVVDGSLEIFDSTQIFEYFEDLRPTPALWPASIRDRAKARLLETKSDEVFFPAAFAKTIAHLSDRDHPEAVEAKALAMAYYAEMEKQLAGREYLAGQFTYADIAFYMAQMFAAVVGNGMPGELKELNAWRLRMAARPAVKAVAEAVVAYMTERGAPAPAYEAA